MRDLNDLSFFAAVVTHGGFSSASRALAVPKSRISRRVAALEAQLGVRLVERSTRRFNVTEVGHEAFGADRTRVGDIATAVPRRVVGVDGTQLSQPRQLTRPSGTTAHQAVYQDHRFASSTTVG